MCLSNLALQHWGLWLTGSEPPAGYLVHATDANRRALDLRKETRKVSKPLSSKTMVACLKIADSPGIQVLDAAADSVGLMDPRSLPRDEPEWTCRVFVKQVIKRLRNDGRIDLPVSRGKFSAAMTRYNGMTDRWLGQTKSSISASPRLIPAWGLGACTCTMIGAGCSCLLRPDHAMTIDNTSIAVDDY